MPCKYCDKKFTSTEIDIMESSVCSGYPYSHCKQQEAHAQKEHEKMMAMLEENQKSADKAWHKWMDYEIALLNSKK